MTHNFPISPMKIRRDLATKYALGGVSLALYGLFALLGLVLMAVAAWQYARFAENPEFFRTAYSPDIQTVLLLFLADGLLLLLVCVVGLMFSTLFIIMHRGAGVALWLLGVGLMAVLAVSVIAATVQWEHWDRQRKLLPQILENRTRDALFSPDDWFGRELAWFQDTFQCCGYVAGADFTDGLGAQYALESARNLSVPVSSLPDTGLWRPRSCCDDFTVGPFDCTEQVASYNGPPGAEGCGRKWLGYLADNQWALVGLAVSAAAGTFVLAQIPLWLLAHQVAYTRKEEGLLDEEEE